MRGRKIMADLSSSEDNNESAHKSIQIRKYIATVVGFLLVAGYFYYDSYPGIKTFIVGLIFVLIAAII